MGNIKETLDEHLKEILTAWKNGFNAARETVTHYEPDFINEAAMDKKLEYQLFKYQTPEDYWKGRLSDLESLMGMSHREGEIDSFEKIVSEDAKNGLHKLLICPNCKFEYSEDDYINQICNRCDYDANPPQTFKK